MDSEVARLCGILQGCEEKINELESATPTTAGPQAHGRQASPRLEALTEPSVVFLKSFTFCKWQLVVERKLAASRLAEINRLKRSLNDMENQMATLCSHVDKRSRDQSEWQALQDQLELLRSSNSRSASQLHAAQEELAETAQSARRWQDVAESRSSKIVELETELHQLQAALFELQQDLQRIQVGRLDADSLAIRLEAAEQRGEHEQQRVQELTRELSALQEKHDAELRGEKQLCKERIHELQRQLESTQARSEQQRANLHSTQSDLGRQVQECARLQQNLSELENVSLARDQAIAEVDTLERELASARARMAEQKLHIEELQAGHEALKSDNRDLQHELSSTRSEVGNLELALQQCEVQLDELQAACLRFADAERKLQAADESLKTTSESLRQCANEKEELLFEAHQLSLLSSEVERERRRSPPRICSKPEKEQRASGIGKQPLHQSVCELRDARVLLQAFFEEKVQDLLGAKGELKLSIQQQQELQYEAETQRQRVLALEADGDQLRLKVKEQEDIIRDLNKTVATLQLQYTRLGSTMAIEEAEVCELQQALRNSLQDAKKMADKISEQSAELSILQHMNLHLKHSLGECSEKAAQIESMVRKVSPHPCSDFDRAVTWLRCGRYKIETMRMPDCSKLLRPMLFSKMKRLLGFPQSVEWKLPWRG
jgi:chromosome segregation ATPase